MACILFVIAGLLWLGLGSSRPEGVLLLLALGATALGYPLGSLIMPSFDPMLSPKNQALLMRAYIDQGYTPASFNVYGGTYSFYTGHVIKELKQLDEIPPLAEKGKLVLAMRLSAFDKWVGRPECLTEVQRQWIESKQYVLLACPPIADLKPAPVPYKPAPDILGDLFKLAGVDNPFKKAPEAAKPAAPAAPAAPTAPSAPAAPVAPAAPATPEAAAPAAPEAAAPATPDAAPAAPAPEAPAATPAPEAAAPAAPESPAPAETPTTSEAAPEAAKPEASAPAETAPEAAPEKPAETPAEPAASEAAPADAAGQAGENQAAPPAAPEAPAADPAAPETAPPAAQ
jgi:hypothetical protein